MRLLIVGTLGGHIGTAGQIAIKSGAKVNHVDTIDAAWTCCARVQGADVVMIDVTPAGCETAQADEGRAD